MEAIYSPSDSPGQNTGVSSLSLLQGIFPTQNQTGVSCIAGRFFTQLSHKGSPKTLDKLSRRPHISITVLLDLPNPGIKPRSPVLQTDSLPAEPPGKPKNIGVGSYTLLQRILPTQGLSPGLPHGRGILYQLSHQGSPRILEWVAYSFSKLTSQIRNQTGVCCIAGGLFTS